jgi:hypothetical protein
MCRAVITPRDRSVMDGLELSRTFRIYRVNGDTGLRVSISADSLSCMPPSLL